MLLSTIAIPRTVPRAGPARVRPWWALLLAALVALLSACGGGGGSGGAISLAGLIPQAPSGLAYAMTSSVYEVGVAIVPNRPSASGGAVQRYSVAPPLPAGLAIDAGTGVISGTPDAVSPRTVYTVTAENAGGSATARVEIEVRQTPAAPAGLRYAELAPVYTVGAALAPNVPTSSGGPITGYSVAPALPAGLVLDPVSGVISGTPGAPSPAADHVVTGSNAAGSATVTLRVTVQAAPAAPASLAYATPQALYVAGDPIAPNTALLAGGPADSFSVAPALPAGLSLNTATGAITGTPATVQPQASYTVTASNASGSVQAQLTITVTGKGAWATAASLPGGRYYAAAVRLVSGQVLVAGGTTNSGPIGSAAIYEPVGGLWLAAAPMLVARADPSATLLQDGRVLVVGGDTAGGTTQASAEIYDPVADTWTATGSMLEPRTRHSATLLPDGKVLVIGGYRRVGGTAPYSQTAELYDPATGTWTPMLTPLSTTRGQHAGVLLADGSAVLLIGGAGDGGNVGYAELYPVNDVGPSAPVAGSIPPGTIYTGVLLTDGSVLALSASSTVAVRYHPATSSWTTSLLASGAARLLPTMTVLQDGRVLLAGGHMQATTEIYHPDANAWTVASPMAVARNRATATLLGDGTVLIAGGFSGTAEIASAERFTP